MASGTPSLGGRAPPHAPRSPGRRRLLAALAGSALPGALRAAEEPYPARPIRLILPSAIGGSGDLLARLIAARLGDTLGQPLVIEAKPGAAGRIALDFVAAAAPDGHTLLLANNGANAIGESGRGVAPQRANRSFTPVILLARLPLVVAVNPSPGIDTLQALIARARQAPAELAYASGGPGSTSQMAATLLFRQAGVTLRDVPYAGTASAVKDVLAGIVPVLFTHLGTVATLVRAGRLRALAQTGARRMGQFESVPTVGECGYPGFDVTTWHGILAPVGTPAAVVEFLRARMAGVLAAPGVREQLADDGMDAVGAPPDEFTREIERDVRRWSAVLDAQRESGGGAPARPAPAP